MNNIKCPHCGEVFAVDKSGFAEILSQVRTQEFEQEIHAQLEKEKQILTVQSDAKLAELKNQLKTLEQAKNAEVKSVEEKTKSALQTELMALKAALEKAQLERENLEQAKNAEVKLVEEKTKSALQTELMALKADLEKAQLECENLEQKKTAEVKLVEEKVKLVEEKTKSALQTELSELKAQLQRFESEKQLMLQQTVSENEKALIELAKERDAIKNKLLLTEKEKELNINAIKTEYKSLLQIKNDEVESYKNFKAQQSTKAIGESLETFAENEFNKVRANMFPKAYFEKDNEVKNGTKGDFIYREHDEYGNEIISIMFEMKNESDDTTNKHKNREFYKKLDKDRNNKNCEYAVLVTMLESDNDYFNTGIVDVSHEYPKMYVIRPNFFIQLIGLLRNAAMNTLIYKQDLARIREQNIDISTFEDDLDRFKNGFSKHYESAKTNFETAINEIDKSINRMKAVKKALQTSENQLSLANTKLEDVSIKKLTNKNETMAKKFKALK